MRNVTSEREHRMNLYLIGYRGSGKSTVAPIVAKSLGWETVVSDDLIEANSKMSIARIFAQLGESDFRQRESGVISKIGLLTHQVASLGGGAPMFKTNQEAIARSGKTVYLTADFEILWKRISNDDSTADRRPDLTDQGGRKEVEQLVAERHPVYDACADYTIDVGKLNPEEIAQRIVKWFQSVDKQE